MAKKKTSQRSSQSKSTGKSASTRKRSLSGISRSGNKAEQTIVSPKIRTVDMERIIELDFARCTEAAALNAFRFLGKGNGHDAHAAAVDALRGTLDRTSMCASSLYGDGLKPQPDGIQPGEKLGNWNKGSLQVDLATVPIDGIDLVANGTWGAVSCMAASRQLPQGSAFMSMPCDYVDKIAFGPAVQKGPEQVHLNASVRDNLEIIAMKLGKRVQDLNVAVLDRKRHQKLIGDIRKAGASVRLFTHGDIGCCIAPSLGQTGIDVYMGTGGGVEAVVAAAALRCLGGNLLIRFAPTNDKEKKQCLEAYGDKALGRHFTAEDLAKGDGVIFCATGISDGSILQGVHVTGSVATTNTVVMRSKYRTVRYIKAEHNLAKKKIRLRSAEEEAEL